jgi:CheY-like chemotaxis protein
MPTVLLIDDDDLVRQSLGIGLIAAGFSILTASSGTEGLRLLSDNAVDVVVTDIFMPDGEGIELITRLRAGGSRIPIIAITGGYSDARTLAMGRDDTGLVLKSATMLGATRVNECLREVLSERSQQDNDAGMAPVSGATKTEARRS